MFIFLKYILKSMWEKKGRSILLLVAISLSTGLLVGSLGIVDIAIDIFSKTQLEQAEHKEIYIVSDTSEPYFKISNLHQEGIINIVPQIALDASYDINKDEMAAISVIARENEYIDESILIENSNLKGFSGNKCIISKRVSEELGLDVGSQFEITIDQKDLKFEVYALASNRGAFYSDQKSNFVIITPYKFIANEFSARGKYNYVAANKSEEKVSESVDLFNDTNNKFKAYELYSESTVMMAIGMIAGVLYMMFAIIVGMSMIIIYSSFKLIITERLKVIGTFLSQGSTKQTIKRILKLEGVGYGILGGILGDIIGCIITYVGNYEMSPMHQYGIIEKFDISVEYLIAGFIFAVLLPVISASIPIRKINKLEVKELILNTPSMVENGGWLKFIIGILCIIIAALYTLFGNDQILIMAPIVLLFSIIGVMNVAPKCIAFISNQVFKYTKGIFPVISIALNNVGTSKVLLGNINLMLIAMLTVVLINSTSISMEKSIRAGYSDLNYDLKVTITRNEKLVMSILRGEKSIDKKTLQKMYTANTQVNGVDFYTLGIDEDKYTSYDHYFDWGKEEYGVPYEQFKSGPYNSTIISQKVADTLQLKVGDQFEVEVNEKTQPLIVKGIIDGKLYYNSLFIMVKNVVFTDRFRVKFADTIVCNTTKDPAVIKNKLSEDIHKNGGSISTYPETIEANVQQIGQLISILNIFSYMAIIISALGVINNISISFIQRKKSIVVLSSVGMAYGQFKRMLIVESLFTIIWPVVIITLYSTMGMKLVSATTKLMGLALDIRFNVNIIPSLLVVSSIIIVVATIPALLMNKKMKIVDELKYE